MVLDARPILLSSLLLLATCLLGEARAMDLTASGTWATTIDATNLLAGAGSELESSDQSATSQIVLEISATGGSTDTWRLDVRRADSSWPSALALWVRRTGGGSGAGSIDGGLSWVEVGSTDTSFFSGEGNRDSIPVQLRITGLSLGLSPDSYLSTVHYSLVDTL